MSNGNVQQNLLCATFCHKESSHLAPVLAYDFLSRCKFSILLAHFCTVLILGSIRKTLWLSFRRHFLCGALSCNFSSTEHEGLSTHVQRKCSAESFVRSILSQRIFTSRPGSRVRFFIEMQIQYSTSTLLYSINIRLYPQNPVVEFSKAFSVRRVVV